MEVSHGSGGSVLEIEKQWAPGEGAAVRAVAANGDQRNVCEATVGAFRGAGTETDAIRSRRRVVEEGVNAVKDVATGKEAAENLGIAAMNPFAAELPGVLAFNDREIIANVGAIKEFVDRRLQEKRLAEAEVGGEAHRGIRNAVCVGRKAGPGLTGVGQVDFVEHTVRESAEPIGADRLDFGRAFDAVGGGPVCRHIEGLIGILGPVEVVGPKGLTSGVQVVVDATENRGVAD